MQAVRLHRGAKESQVVDRHNLRCSIESNDTTARVKQQRSRMHKSQARGSIGHLSSRVARGSQGASVPAPRLRLSAATHKRTSHELGGGGGTGGGSQALDHAEQPGSCTMRSCAQACQGCRWVYPVLLSEPELSPGKDQPPPPYFLEHHDCCPRSNHQLTQPESEHRRLRDEFSARRGGVANLKGGLPVG